MMNPLSASHGSDVACKVTYARMRARARRRQSGAAMFIVAMTLGLIAAMAMYGLSSTTLDIRAAGHLREAAQAQGAAEHVLMLAADSFTSGTAGEIIKAMQSGKKADGTDIQTSRCRTANALITTTIENRVAQACLSWSVKEMYNISKSTNPWTLDATTDSTFAPDSFGAVGQRAFVRVEVTNPVDIPPPPGTGLNDRFTFTQLTVTTYVDMKRATTEETAKAVKADSVAQGRGRITVGPYFRQ